MRKFEYRRSVFLLFLSWLGCFPILRVLSAYIPEFIPGLNQNLVQVSALQNRKAELPCDLEPDEENNKQPRYDPEGEENSPILILWYKGNPFVPTTPIYSFDARAHNITRGVHWTANTRLRFEIRQNTGYLVIRNVSGSDQGLYKCRVDYKVAQSRHSTLNLTVIAPPSKPAIYDVAGNVLQGTVGPLTAGQPLHLKCVTRGGTPLPKLRWYRDRVLVSENSSASRSDRGVVEAFLAIAAVQRNDIGSNFTCSADNTNLTSEPLRTTVTLRMNLPPISIRLVMDSDVLVAGKSQKIICEAHGSTPAPTFEWRLGNKTVSEQEDVMVTSGNVSKSVFLFTPTDVDENSELSCSARNRHLPHSAPIVERRRLRVSYPPVLRISYGSNIEPGGITEGSNVYMECQVRANPRVHTLDWLKDGNPVSDEVAKDVQRLNQTLLLKQVQRKASGAYQCQARNAQGTSVSQKLGLRVKFAPVCSENLQTNYYASERDAINITCQVEADPAVTNFRWKFNGSGDSMSIPPKSIISHGLTSTLEFIPFSELDYGRVLCWATNAVGTQETPCVFNIHRAERPEPVTGCTLTQMDAASFSVSCIPGKSHTSPQDFLLRLSDGTSYKPTNVTKDRVVFTLLDLEKGVNYSAMIYATNDKWKSSAAELRIMTTDQPKSSPSLSSFPNNPGSLLLTVLGSVLGGLATIVILFLSCWLGRRRSGATRSTRATKTWVPGDKSSTPLRKDLGTSGDGVESDLDVAASSAGGAFPTTSSQLVDYTKGGSSSFSGSSCVRIVPGGLWSTIPPSGGSIDDCWDTSNTSGAFLLNADSGSNRFIGGNRVKSGSLHDLDVLRVSTEHTNVDFGTNVLGSFMNCGSGMAGDRLFGPLESAGTYATIRPPKRRSNGVAGTGVLGQTTADIMWNQGVNNDPEGSWVMPDGRNYPSKGAYRRQGDKDPAEMEETSQLLRTFKRQDKAVAGDASDLWKTIQIPMMRMDVNEAAAGVADSQVADNLDSRCKWHVARTIRGLVGHCGVAQPSSGRLKRTRSLVIKRLESAV